jgi:hypothetical protein
MFPLEVVHNLLILSDKGNAKKTPSSIETPPQPKTGEKSQKSLTKTEDKREGKTLEDTVPDQWFKKRDHHSNSPRDLESGTTLAEGRLCLNLISKPVNPDRNFDAWSNR